MIHDQFRPQLQHQPTFCFSPCSFACEFATSTKAIHCPQARQGICTLSNCSVSVSDTVKRTTGIQPPVTCTPQRYSLMMIGVMLVALTKSDAKQISALFQRTGVESNTLEKHYLALIRLGHVKTLDELQETHLRTIKNSLCNDGDGRMSLWREELQMDGHMKGRKLKAMSECEPLATSVRMPQLSSLLPAFSPDLHTDLHPS
jgi:hypothetical protein